MSATQLGSYFQPTVEGMLTETNDVGRRLAAFLFSKQALITIDTTKDEDSPGALRRIELKTTLPVATDAAVYAPLTEAGFRVVDSDDKKLKFVCSGDTARLLTPVIGGVLEGTSGRPRHVHCVLVEYCPQALRERTAYNLVKLLQDTLTVTKWHTLHVMRDRRTRGVRWGLPARYGDMIPAAEALLSSDAIVDYVAFLYIYNTYVSGYATSRTFSSGGGMQYSSNIKPDNWKEFNSAMVKVTTKFRELVVQAQKSVPESEKTYEMC